MPKEIKETNAKQPEKIPLESMPLNDLKAEVYDRASMIEQHQMAIQKLQQEINEVNKYIAEKSK